MIPIWNPKQLSVQIKYKYNTNRKNYFGIVAKNIIEVRYKLYFKKSVLYQYINRTISILLILIPF